MTPVLQGRAAAGRCVAIQRLIVMIDRDDDGHLLS